MKQLSFVSMFISCMACGAENPTAGLGVPPSSAETSPPSAQPAGDVVVRWDPPAGYVQVGAVTVEGEYPGFTNPWKSPVCTMSLDRPGHLCRINVVAGTKILFGVKRVDARAPTGSAWVFDHSCDGPWAGCGKSFGSVSVWKNGASVPFELVWNGTGPKPPAAVFFTGVIVIPP